MIGALLLGLVAGVIGRMLVLDMWSGLSVGIIGVISLLPLVGVVTPAFGAKRT